MKKIQAVQTLSCLMDLEFMGESDSSSIFRIMDHNSSDSASAQIVKFSHNDYSIEFIEPFREKYEYLNINIKRLRSILRAALEAEDKTNFKIPFLFPSETECKINPDNAIKVYSDGSCSGSGTGGWASIILKTGNSVIEISGNEERSTSNRMELMAAFKGIEYAAGMLTFSSRECIQLFSDSFYVIKGITHRLGIWTANGFITAKGTPAANIDIWKKIAEILNKADVLCQWVKSGDNDPFHKRCDLLAGEECKNISPEKKSGPVNSL